MIEIVMPLFTPLVNFHVYVFLLLKSSLCVTQKEVTNHEPGLLTTKGNPPLSAYAGSRPRENVDGFGV